MAAIPDRRRTSNPVCDACADPIRTLSDELNVEYDTLRPEFIGVAILKEQADKCRAQANGLQARLLVLNGLLSKQATSAPPPDLASLDQRIADARQRQSQLQKQLYEAQENMFSAADEEAKYSLDFHRAHARRNRPNLHGKKRATANEQMRRFMQEKSGARVKLQQNLNQFAAYRREFESQDGKICQLEGLRDQLARPAASTPTSPRSQKLQEELQTTKTTYAETLQKMQGVEKELRANAEGFVRAYVPTAQQESMLSAFLNYSAHGKQRLHVCTDPTCKMNAFRTS